ncbi:Mitochondrial cryptochrome [Podospora pseudocomata]|uniref:Mitochondrial cryptochrome n=1 Tax=Podospora pseudocomata TaxID=2093779 RepID=A0ABR0GW70_9PEZI|nr:Mitochondrial cryptochrome [Podospora pseudocomata]
MLVYRTTTQPSSDRSHSRATMTVSKAPQNILIHIIRRDLRTSDNPLFHAAATAPDEEKFDAYLPLYVFDAQQIDVSGFIHSAGATNPYGSPRSQVAGYHRCGPHRAKFLGEAVWDLSETLKELKSGLFIRVGRIPDVVETLVSELAKKDARIGAVWMTSHEGSEEKADEKAVASLCKKVGAKWKLWVDEKYFIDDRDTGLESIDKLPGVFTEYKKKQLPLREKPRPVLPPIEKGSLPPLIDAALVAPQSSPFHIPDSLDRLVEFLVAPVKDFLPNKPEYPKGAESAHPYQGGEHAALQRLKDLISSGAATTYDTTRNGLLGTEFSTKLSAFLAQGCITARQVHAAMDSFERGTDPAFKDVEGFGALIKEEGMSEDEAQNTGMESIRTELLWRDYMRLCHQKDGNRLFQLTGTLRYKLDHAADMMDGMASITAQNGHNSENSDTGDNGAASAASDGDGSAQEKKLKSPDKERARPQQGSGINESLLAKEWKSADKEKALPRQSPTAEEVAKILERFNLGTTGMGLIDASQRELLHTGYTSNRARQNVASFLAKHLDIDWRYGAEWYEMLLVDYDVSSNWANWQYVAGVGNDPRGHMRIFNPVKQGFEYDPSGSYVRTWIPEVSGLEKLENAFQPWTASKEELEKTGLSGNDMVANPVKRIQFVVEGKPRTNKNGGFRRALARGNPSKASQANGNGSGFGNGSGNGYRNSQDVRTDAPVVNGTTRGPRGRGGFRGLFGGPPRGSLGGGRGGFHGNTNGSPSPAANQGNGNLAPGYGRGRGGGRRGGGGGYGAPPRGGGQNGYFPAKMPRVNGSGNHDQVNGNQN